MNTFAHSVWNEEETTNGNTSILKALSVVIETETNDDDEMNEQSDIESEKPIEEPKQDEEQEIQENGKTRNSEDDEKDSEKMGNGDDNGGDDADQSVTATEENEIAQTNDGEEHQSEIEQNADNDESEEKSNKNEETKSSARTTPITPITTIKSKNQMEIKIPPIWTPSEKRTNAALIYLYFRSVSLKFKTKSNLKTNYDTFALTQRLMANFEI